MIATRDLGELPGIDDVRTVTRALAMLDGVLRHALLLTRPTIAA